ncbi:hypothetical protein FOE78_09410 [Microlunatus elymi]|uniref:Uncharacterized protein n=1 Tax=Microlunatus elymi TaxID=2596828 RepID=A0A516PY43_9ACTN|nr:hypothetical protein [Microlunatus elymi]QDP96086.1 hypothetical protein FOE78_09410 [Microlunatus elymi]
MTRFVNLPGAPVLLPRVAGSSDPAAELRAAAREAIAAILPDRGRVIVTAGGIRTRTWDVATPYDLGRLLGRSRVERDRTTSSIGDSLPLPLAVARALLGVDRDRLTLITVADDSAPPFAELLDDLGRDDLGDDDLVVTVADGSALGKAGGPDVVHPRADEFDRALTEAWLSGQPGRLTALDSGLAAEVLSNGTAVWRLAAGIAAQQRGSTPYRSRISFADAPFGVYYLIASWS